MNKTLRILATLLLLAAFLALPYLFKNPYLLYVTDTGLVYALAVLGLVVLAGYAGLLSLGQAAFYAVGAYTSGLLVVKLGVPVWVGILAAMAFSALWGVLVGLPSFKLEGPFLVIITIGFAEIVRLFVLNAQALTGGPFGLSQIKPLAIGSLTLNTPQSFYYFILALNLLVVAAVARLRRSRVGQAMVAARDDEVAAASMGINVQFYKVTAFAISAMLAGLSGALYGHLTSYLNPDLFTYNTSANFLTMNVVGGIESVIGGVVSAVAVTILPETLRFLKDYYMLMFSVILMLLVLCTAWLENLRNSPDAGGAFGDWVRRMGSGQAKAAGGRG
jgi:branched-chain amino acid transport system permease protein